jgi:uridine kinase
MLGDELVIERHHTDRAEEIVGVLEDRLTRTDKFVITVAGESGSGKSELASEIARIDRENGIPTGILQQDDYFVFPPRTNHEMRKKNIDQVGTYEVKLDFLDSNLRSFKKGAESVYKPLVDYNADRITTEVKEVGEYRVLIAEGTYTTTLEFADFRIFIDRDYKQTYQDRKRRGRDKMEPFVEDVLKREHEIISAHKEKADLVVTPDYEEVRLRA